MLPTVAAAIMSSAKMMKHSKDTNHLFDVYSDHILRLVLECVTHVPDVMLVCIALKQRSPMQCAS